MLSNKQKFEITLDKPIFQNNDPISGYFHLELYEPLNFVKITLKIIKIFELEYENNFENNIENYKNCIYEEELILYNSRCNELGSGYHQFPFLIRLRENDSGTTFFDDFIGNNYLSFKNEYKIKVFIETKENFITDNDKFSNSYDVANSNNIFNFNPKNVLNSNYEANPNTNFNKNTNNISKPNKTLNSNKILVTKNILIKQKNHSKRKITDNINILSCICLSSYKILIIAYLNKESINSSENLEFICKLSSEKYFIKKMKIKIFLNLEIYNKYLKIKKYKKLILENKNSIIEENKCISKFNLPENLPYSCFEKYLKVFYEIEAIVYINRGSPVKISRNFFVEPKLQPKDKYFSIGAIKGIKFPINRLDL